MWIVTLILFYILAVISRITRREFAVKYPQFNRANLLMLYGALMLVGPVVALFMGFDLSLLTPKMLLIISGLSMFWPISAYFTYKANVHLDAGFVTLITSFAAVIATTIAVVVLGEDVNTNRMVGLGLMMLAITIVTHAIQGGSKSNPYFLTSVGFAMIATLFAGLGSPAEKFIISEIEIGTYMLVGFYIQSFWVWLLFLRGAKDELAEFFADNGRIAIESLPYVLSSTAKSLFFIATLSLVDASIAVPASQFITVLVVIVAYFATNEREHVIEKLSAAVIGSAGLVFLGLG